MFDFSRLVLQTTPYPIGLSAPVLDEALYQTLVTAFPPPGLFKHFGPKSSLSERNHPQAYHAFLAASPIWLAVYQTIKDPAFARRMRVLLDTAGVPMPEAPLRARFEFASMPAAGGELRPHRDLPSKVVTLVVSMLDDEGAWDPAWGGSTDVLVPRDPQQVLQDYAAPRSAFDVVHTYPYRPNQCVVFVKSDHSWHAVGPLTGRPTNPPRRTLTINLERVAS